ncbi:hypothetical protein HOA55_04365 [archaeon]|jgi:hypothetical protein|nr:hypothetical protein [archaeon]MBT3577960.1 hypothetical protein [archaeon]MBT6820563.1 hypothetical protein [archaeon]MBT6955932.1 hypothetical protein [archaeon]MBT7025814.1 hypothetical protein [archaeon]
MGKIIRLDTKLALPTQPTLRQRNIKRVIRSFLRSPKKMIVPVRTNPRDPSTYLILDGHHSTCVADTLNEFRPGFVDIFGWITEDNQDLIERLPQDFHQGRVYSQNENIEGRFENVPAYHEWSKVPKTIREMRGRYEPLRSARNLMRYATNKPNLAIPQ